jgi:4-amino-4-deoxy-L-arabinose transferase-like glycosyltransferase
MLARARNFFNPEDQSRLPRRLFWTAFLVRVLYVALAHTWRIRATDDHFQFGWEAGRIARALVNGFGYSDPFANAAFPHTGPTAWLPPLYPLLLAAIFKLFGVYTRASAFVLFTLQSAFSAATALATYEIAARCFSRRVALWSAWVWALHPAAMQYAVRWPWEMSITTALFSFTVVLALRLRGIGSCRLQVAGCQLKDAVADREVYRPATDNLQQTTSWLLFGLLWGLIALANSTLLIFLPVCGVWILLGTRRRPHALRDAVLAALVFLACVAPWSARNERVFHTFIPLRGNLGAELYMGNGPGSNGLLMEYEHPFQAPDQLRLYAAMGEVRYVAMRGDAAKRYIADDPAHFVADVARRVYYYWISVPQADVAASIEAGRVIDYAFISLAGLLGLGLALRRRVPAVGLFAWAIVLLPIPYYVITVAARFRHPLEPVLCIFGVYLFQSAAAKRRGAA